MNQQNQQECQGDEDHKKKNPVFLSINSQFFKEKLQNITSQQRKTREGESAVTDNVIAKTGFPVASTR